MSSSDYTNLRRIRHVYHPTMSNCHPNVQPQVVYTTPTEGNCYVGTYPSHNHVPSYPNVHNHHPSAPHYVHPPAPHYAHPPAPHYAHPPAPHYVHPPAPHYAHSHVPHYAHSHVPHYAHSHVPHTEHSHFGCHPEEHTHVDDDSHPCDCTGHVHHTHETVVVQNHPGSYGHVHSPTHTHSSIVPHSHSSHLGAFATRYQYLITPVVNGSVTFSVDSNLHFTKDMRVTVTSDLSNNNYIEGSVYYYNPCNGEITIYKISTISGTFTSPSKYIISFGTPYQEIDKLKLKTAELYEKVFGTTTSTSTLTETELQALGDRVTNLYKYFFNDDISTTDSIYALTETYLTAKMNTLYNYFFDTTFTNNAAFNPNNNGILMDTLTIKIDQMYLYFFGAINSTIIS